ncbi:MAG: hypothetical protein SFU56_21425 [Capsulimonadales bacterium]|nr:hypothetical protein [Capsulimonadales bacterium]
MSAQVEHGVLSVIQNDANNNLTSVTVTKTQGTADFNLRPGSNRGDYNIRFSDAPDNDSVNGVAISSVRQNGRNNGATPNAGGNTSGLPAGIIHSTSAVTPNNPNDVTGSFFIPVFAAFESTSPAVDNVEFNVDVAVAYFAFSDGWLAGTAGNGSAGNNQPMTAQSSRFAPGINLGNQFVDQDVNAGTYLLNLTGLGASSQNGILLVGGAKNEDNYALSRDNADGTFTIFCHDNAQNGASYENDPISFVYVPNTAVNVTAGRVRGDGTLELSFNGFTDGTGGTAITRLDNTGRYLIRITGQTDTTGTLIISPEGGESNNVDNIVTYEWNPGQNGWIVETRDLSATGAGANPQNLNAAEGAFSFAFFSNFLEARPFSLSATAPEPTSFLFLSLTLGFLPLRRWRRRSP